MQIVDFKSTTKTEERGSLVTNTNLLLEYINKSGLKKVHIAKHLGITSYSLSKKINNKSEFKGSEMEKMSEILGLNNRERDSIFFAR